MKTPIAFFSFCRPETTAKVFAAIRKARPSRLLLVADGPRPDKAGEIERVGEVRRLLKVDWPCKVQRNFSERNLGCRKRLSSGLTWVFEQVPEAIVLEDDCLPHAHFFRYSAELLARHRHDERVMMVCGTALDMPPRDRKASYRFSRYALVWGWASWRRAWRHYDESMAAWPRSRREGLLQEVFPGQGRAQRYWEDNFQAVHRGKLDTWDYQWVLNIWQQRGLCVLPRWNLIQNIGVGLGATRSGAGSSTVLMPLEPMRWPLRPPRQLQSEERFDRRLEDERFSGPLQLGPKTRLRQAWQQFARRWAR